MAKVKMMQQRSDSRRRRKLPSSSCCMKISADGQRKKRCSKASEKKDWHNATCSVCMEHPHNAVLLLCSSYDKGCRPYMCATSSRYSNCLEQYKKAYMKVDSVSNAPPLSRSANHPDLVSVLGCSDRQMEEVSELLCPLCRGQAKGWTVVEPARKYLNAKKRTCMQNNCSYVGSYKELRKHVREQHPRGRPREIDPSVAEKWKKLEHERERNDVFSTIRSTMPGAIIMGDYVIEGNYPSYSGDYDEDDLLDEEEDYFDDALFRLEPYGQWNTHSREISDDDFHALDDGDFQIQHTAGTSSGRIDNFISRIARYRNRLLLGRARRWRRRRAGNRVR